MAARKNYPRPAAVKVLFALLVLYLAASSVFFATLLSDTLSPAKFGTFTILFSFLIVAYLFALFFGLWKMNRWGLYFILFVAGVVVVDMVTGTVFSELHFGAPAADIVYQIISAALVAVTLYVAYHHKNSFE
jgi:hypothetical protein